MYKPEFRKREVLVFRHWAHKGYSLFACLGREVVISVLSVAMLQAAKADGISDETFRADSSETVREVWLGEVGVTGSRAPLTQSQAARMVTVLSHDDIRRAAVQSVNDLLKLAAGVDVRQRGALGSQTDISVRGGTAEQVAVLLNGINIGDAQTAHNVMDLPVDLDEVVRVEVLEGPAGRAYGTSSLVGAINIVTRPEATPQTHVRLEGGSYGYLRGSARSTLHASQHWRQQVSGSYSRSDGYSRAQSGRRNTDFSGAKGFYQGSYEDDDTRLSWHLGIADKGWGSSTFYASPRWQADDQYEHTTKVMAALQAETRTGRLHLRPSLYWAQHRDRYEGYRNAPDRMAFNYNRTEVAGIGLNAFFDWALGRTAFGGELRNEDLVSGNLGEPLSRPRHIHGTDRQYTLGLNRTGISAHLEHNVLLRRLTLSAGFVAARNTQSDMHTTLYPGVDVSWRPAQGLTLFGSYNTSLRMPSFTELYYKLQGYAANPHLRPEEMRAVEVGASWQSPLLTAKLTAYHHHGRNMIDWIMDTRLGNQAEWQSVNHTRLNSNGAEIDVALSLSRILSPTLPEGATLHLTYNYIDQDKKLEEGLVSQYALEYLRHKAVATLHLPIWSTLAADVSWRWQDRVGNYTDFDGRVRSYRPYSLTDVKLTYALGRQTIYASANNLWNKKNYADYGNIQQPGLWLIGGITWKL